MPSNYRHHFQEMCDRLSYNCVVFLRETGEVLAFRSIRAAAEPTPRTCNVNINYDAVPADNSRVFYGLDLTFDNRIQIVSGSVSLIDVDGATVVVVFFEQRVSSFRDNQLPRIFWKDIQGVYRGHSDYVPYENGLKSSMIGKTDKELFSRQFTSDFESSDRAILEKEVCFWNMMGKIKTNVFTSLVKMEKFPYYTMQNALAGILMVYWPINHADGVVGVHDVDDRQELQALVNRSLSEANVYLLVSNVEGDTRIEYYSDNLNRLGYDFEQFIDGRLTLKDVVYPADLDRYLTEVRDILYSRKESYSSTIRLVNADQEIVWAKISMTPLVGEDKRMRKIGLVIQFPEALQDLGQNYQKLVAVVSRTHVVYTVRRTNDPWHLELVTENVNQFGYAAEEFTREKKSYRELLHPADLADYETEIDNLMTGRIRQVVLEYRIANRRKQYYWVKESIFVVTIDGIDYLESAISNITSTKNAADALRDLDAMPEGETTPDFSFSTVVRYADLDGALAEFTRQSGIGAIAFNNAGTIMNQDRDTHLTWKIIRDSLEGFSTFATAPEPKSSYSDLRLAVHPIERRGARIGTLLLYGRLAGAASGSRLVNDLGLFPPLVPGQLESVSKYAGIIASNLAYMIEIASMATLQIQTSSSFRGDIDRQRRIREIMIDVIDHAAAAADVKDAFRRIMPLVGTAMELSRISLSSFREQKDVFDVVAEWYDESCRQLERRKDGVDLRQTYYADWHYDTEPVFAVNAIDIVSDPGRTRDFAHAVIGVRLAVQGAPWGFLSFVDNQSRRLWSADDTAFLESVGAILHTVLDRSAQQGRGRTNRTDYIRILDSLPSAAAIVGAETAAILYANGVFADLFLRRETIPAAGGIRGEAYVKSILSVETTPRAVKEIYLKEIDRWFIVNRSPADYGEDANAELVILTDITANKKTQETISSLAFTDVLTGLPNRSKFELDLKKNYEMNSAMYTNSFIGIVNIDNFKLINNMYSYSFGDALLKALALHLNKIPEIRDKIYRFGGDEFSFLVKNLYGEQVYEVAHKVMRIFDSPFYIEGYETACTVSLGIAFLTDTNKDPDDLIRKANLALADAKASGKNKFVLYDVSLQKFQEDTVSLERALKTAVDDGCGEFKVYFQPIIDARTGKITAAEALVRWFSAEYGFVSPVKFIPVAEQTGLIIPLGKYILNAAVKEAKKWLDYGRDIAVSVNFSVIQILQTDLVQTLLKALQTYKLPAKNLMFEITESLAVNDINKIIEILTAVRQIGVKIAMDDFGTGYSSLNHLRKMPLDIVKIDRSFIFNIEFDPYTVAFVDTIAKFCHMKGTRICCEGIENETQKGLLKGVNVDSMQGYLFGKPAPGDEFWKRLITD